MEMLWQCKCLWRPGLMSRNWACKTIDDVQRCCGFCFCCFGLNIEMMLHLLLVWPQRWWRWRFFRWW
jgi:hypothetical protein